MKDSGVKACVGMVCVTAIYGVYVVAHVLVGEPIPNGVVLTGVVGVVTGLAGYSVAVAQATAKAQKPS